MATKEITKGCVVYMNADSGMKGYGNPQCVSWVSHELGELSLYGHNEHYKTYDVREVVEPSPEQDAVKEVLRKAYIKLSFFLRKSDEYVHSELLEEIENVLNLKTDKEWQLKILIQKEER